MKFDRRRFLSVIGATTTSGLAGCTASSPTESETESTTVTETNDTTTKSENNVASSRKLAISSQADNVESFDQRLIRQSDESTIYRDTYTYDPGESLVLGENFEQGSTYKFEMARPGGEPVFEYSLHPYIARLEVTIQSATSVERTGITEV